MSENGPLAHSPRGDVPAQDYVTHVTEVRAGAIGNARRASDFYSGDRDSFVGWVDAAAVYHDLGKLDDENQAVLKEDSRKPLPIAHEDAGVAELDGLNHGEPAVLVAAHHGGLFSLKEELQKGPRLFRLLDRETPAGIRVADHVDAAGRLDAYREAHVRAGCPVLSPAEPLALHGCGFTRRVALSCLVDADHGDTARHYRREVPITQLEPRWQERAEALQRYVDGLPSGTTDRERRRNELRRQVFETCRDASVEPAIRACDAPVGSGKTTAVTAHLLRVAHEKRLRHIFVVLPYTNIITQSVEVYRKALVLAGEQPEDVVAEHHHRADFKDLELRQLATLWKAPVIVTTAVQFFETLGSHHPSRLRKLHELPGSAVFVDETHAAMPSHLWPQMWRWLETWTREWAGHLVLASGSLPRFWELPEYTELIRGASSEVMPAVPDLLQDEALRAELRKVEERRVRFRRRNEDRALNCGSLVKFVVEKPGPRLLIVNTVQTAAVVANVMRESGHDVLHLSTALAPAHRDVVVQRVKHRLRVRIEDWTLVATSCVEAGMDFSFRIGIRERASTASLIQVGGRISRGDEYSGGEVWDLLLLDDRFKQNPALTAPRNALGRFAETELNALDSACLATLGMRREWTAGAEKEARLLIEDEEQREYRPVDPSHGWRGVAHRCRLIAQELLTVVIDPGLAAVIRKRGKVSPLELVRHSVQMWPGKVRDLGLESLGGRNGELFDWGANPYDTDFLGYMEGILAYEHRLNDPEAWIL